MSAYEKLDLAQLRFISKQDADNAGDIRDQAAVLRELRDELQDKIDLMREAISPLLGREAVTTGPMDRMFRQVGWTGESAQKMKREIRRLYVSIEDTPDTMDHNAAVLDDIATEVVKTDLELERIEQRAKNSGKPAEDDLAEARDKLRVANEGYSTSATSMRDTRFYDGLREQAPEEPEPDRDTGGAPIADHPAEGRPGLPLPPATDERPAIPPFADSPPADGPQLQTPGTPAPMPPAPPSVAPSPVAPPPVGGVPAIPPIPPSPGAPVRPVIPGAARPPMPTVPRPPAGTPALPKPGGWKPPVPRPVSPPVIGSRPGGSTPYGQQQNAAPRVPNPNGMVRPVIGGRGTAAAPMGGTQTGGNPRMGTASGGGAGVPAAPAVKSTLNGPKPLTKTVTPEPKSKRGKLGTRAGQRAPRAVRGGDEALNRAVVRGAKAPAEPAPKGQEIFAKFTKKDSRAAVEPEKTSNLWFDTSETVSPVIRGARRPQ